VSGRDQLGAVAVAELPALALDPNWADADPDERRCLVVDLRSGSPLAPDSVALVSAWLRSQPVPVIGLSAAGSADGGFASAEGSGEASLEMSQGAPDLASAMDVLVAGEGELRRALRCVEHSPVAAGVLVQVLRAMPTLDLLAGLTLESLAYSTLQGGSEFAAWLRGRQPSREPERPASGPPVLLHRSDGRLEIVLNSPETRNALSVAMRDALAEAFKLVAMDAAIREVHVRGNGPCFSAGGELAEFGTRADPATAHRIRMLRNPARYLAQHGARYHFHVHRACIGAGIELPAFAGRLTAAANTFFQLPELSMGLIPGAGGCVSLCRRIGPQRTAWMAMLGKRVSAQRALEWGLIDAVVD
jgi:hypothetical protein